MNESMGRFVVLNARYVNVIAILRYFNNLKPKVGIIIIIIIIINAWHWTAI
jgi:hypothetical protein